MPLLRSSRCLIDIKVFRADILSATQRMLNHSCTDRGTRQSVNNDEVAVASRYLIVTIERKRGAETDVNLGDVICIQRRGSFVCSCFDIDSVANICHRHVGASEAID